MIDNMQQEERERRVMKTEALDNTQLESVIMVVSIPSLWRACFASVAAAFGFLWWISSSLNNSIPATSFPQKLQQQHVKEEEDDDEEEEEEEEEEERVASLSISSVSIDKNNDGYYYHYWSCDDDIAEDEEMEEEEIGCVEYLWRGDLGWYEYLDLTVINGSVVKLWNGDDHRTRTARETTWVGWRRPRRQTL